MAASSMRLDLGGRSTKAVSASSATGSLSKRVFLPVVSKAQSPPPGAYLGAWVPGLPNNMSALTTFQNMVGKRMSIVMWYEGWSSQNLFNQAAAQAVANQGSTPLVTWEPWDWTAGPNQPAYSTTKILAGNFDSFITSYAQSVKNYGKPIYLRFAHEGNNTAYPWGIGINGNTAQSYVAAWRYVHDIFTRVGATNAIWVWSPNVGFNVPLADMYPGDGYVDWMGLDGYNGGSALAWGGWLSFSDIFGVYYQTLTQLSQKPIMIAETASVEQGGSKAAWITDALLAQLPLNFPRIKAFVWFNQTWTDPYWGSADWRIESSAVSLSAYAQAAANPYFG
ncbi:MAG: beta-mannanase [Chloroflexi bacterium]|nr:beta-mannanase [Chloroflexota bacterium]